ncbi:HXXEE domain-containing protein [Paenibacillus tianjinensis]|uniref:HXXEE domain-containing protein n=1 Tax=Paenibacillus tianjinensis TaxID=2810347 RepID=A0ABX7L9X6_9BACL|nr:HXXEE domain-containing protein [Paenibacillus tianjinensis]QSF44178.1 HXXEE domain-containing protein [Paenibacillus tianjinensis]
MNRLISDTSILWLLPIIFMIHDFEEIIPIPGWVQRNKEQIYNKIPSFAKARVEKMSSLTGSQFSAAVGVLFVLFSAAAFLAYEYHFYLLYMVLSLGLFLHAFFHIGVSLFLRRWTPGVATSVLLLLPYGVLSIDYFNRNDLFVFPDILYFSLIVILLFMPFLQFLHFIGRKLARSEHQ